MASKHEMMYPQTENLPGAPPQYDAATAPPYGGGQMGMGAPQPAPQPGQQVFVMQNTPVVNLGPRPTMVKCPSCNAQQMSRIEYESSMKTHLIAVILCVTTCCCCIPYMIDSCKSTNHLCSNCGAYLGTYSN